MEVELEHLSGEKSRVNATFLVSDQIFPGQFFPAIFSHPIFSPDKFSLNQIFPGPLKSCTVLRDKNNKAQVNSALWVNID